MPHNHRLHGLIHWCASVKSASAKAYMVSKVRLGHVWYPKSCVRLARPGWNSWGCWGLIDAARESTCGLSWLPVVVRWSSHRLESCSIHKEETWDDFRIFGAGRWWSRLEHVDCSDLNVREDIKLASSTAEVYWNRFLLLVRCVDSYSTDQQIYASHYLMHDNISWFLMRYSTARKRNGAPYAPAYTGTFTKVFVALGKAFLLPDMGGRFSQESQEWIASVMDIQQQAIRKLKEPTTKLNTAVKLVLVWGSFKLDG